MRRLGLGVCPRGSTGYNPMRRADAERMSGDQRGSARGTTRDGPYLSPDGIKVRAGDRGVAGIGGDDTCDGMRMWDGTRCRTRAQLAGPGSYTEADEHM